MKTTTLLPALFALAVAGGSLAAAPITFDLKDPKGVNNVQFKLDAPLEAISGTANGITGTVTFDPAQPGATTGRVVVAADTLVVPNSTMQGHLHGKGWLDVATHPEITFDLKELSNVRTEGNVTTADATGTFTIKGTSHEKTVPVTLTYLPGAYGRRINRPDAGGDLLVVRSSFTLQRDEFGIRPGDNEERVANEIELSLALAAGAPQG